MPSGTAGRRQRRRLPFPCMDEALSGRGTQAFGHCQGTFHSGAAGSAGQERLPGWPQVNRRAELLAGVVCAVRPLPDADMLPAGQHGTRRAGSALACVRRCPLCRAAAAFAGAHSSFRRKRLCGFRVWRLPADGRPAFPRRDAGMLPGWLCPRGNRGCAGGPGARTGLAGCA